MKEFVEEQVRWRIHPEDLVMHKVTLVDTTAACELMTGGKCVKVAGVRSGCERLLVRNIPNLAALNA